MNYIDKYGRFHDKQVTTKKPIPSNNAYCYTATAKLLGFQLDYDKIIECYKASKTKYGFNRHPEVQLPPNSRDEVQGAIVLEILNKETLIENEFYFCNLGPPKKTNIFTKLYTLYKIKDAHRNVVWDMPEIWDFVFTLPHQDQYFVLKSAGYEPNWLLTAYFYISSLLTIRKNDRSGMHLLWQKLKYLKMEDSFLYKKIDQQQVIKNYFGEEHPFVRRYE